MTKNEREHAKKHLYKQPGSANWFARFCLRGKLIRETTSTADETEACRIVLERLNELGADRAGVKKFIGPEQKRIKIRELLDALKLDYRLRGKCTGAKLLSNLKPMQEWFGDFKAMELTSMDVDRFIEYAQQHGRHKLAANETSKPAQPASINRALQLLRQSYKLAIRAERLSGAPYIRSLSEKDNARSGFFSDAEVRRVISHLPVHLQDFCLFSYLTGWRSGETKSLLWDSVDADIVYLRRQDSKNREARFITAETGELAELMERRKAARSFQTPTGAQESKYIFHAKGQPIGDFRKSWATACKLAGVSGRLFHDLRRTAAREMIRSGVQQSTAMKITGHKTDSIFRRYNIQSEADMREAMVLRDTRIAAQQQENRLAVPPVTKRVQ